MEFKAQPRTIYDALVLKRKYIIPRFQREYSWEADELNSLWDDLIDSFEYKNGELVASEYFIGSLVLVGDDDDSINVDRQVVDGQQRLMTFTIAFSVLSQKFKSIGQDRLSELVHGYIIGEDENGKHYTKVVSETPKPFFQYRIQQKDIDFSQIPTTAEEKRILFAYKFFDNKLGEQSFCEEIKRRFNGMEIPYTDALKLFRDQILKCKVIYVTVKNFDDAYTIFEVLNAKGKDLTPVDIIKNTLFSVVDQTEPIDEAYEKWKCIREQISRGKNDEMMTFYRHFWLSRYGYTTNKKLVSEFNQEIKNTVAEYEAFLRELEVASRDYAKIVVPSETDWPQPEEKEIFNTLESLNIFGVTQVRIILLALFDAKRRGVLKHKVLLSILEYLQYFHFVFNAICSERPSNLERKYAAYGKKLYNSKSSEESATYINELKDWLNTLLPDYALFEQEFKKLYFTGNRTKDKKVIQYILKKLERYCAGTDEMRPDSFTIEHIMPESTHIQSAGRIGNFLPLGEKLNGKVETKPFASKIQEYRKSQYNTVKKFVEKYGHLANWTEDNINARTIEMAKIMYYQNKVPYSANAV